MNKVENTGTGTNTLYDLSMVEQLCRGNKNSILKMVNAFIGTMTVAGLEIKKALQETDLLTIKRIAHRIKPTLAIYGIVTLENDMLQIEMVENGPDAVKDLQASVEKLDTVLVHVITDMKNKYLIN